MIRLLFVLLLSLGPLVNAHAEDAADELAREMNDLQQNMQKVLEQVQKRAQVDPSPGGFNVDRAREKVVRLASDDRFLRAAQELWAHPKRNLLLWVNLAIFVIMMFVKAWRQAKAANWFTKILVGFFATVATWALMLGAAPALILGEPYHVFVGTLLKTIFS